ncbi:MAG: 7-cyano-7-deazaguanine synthase QueC [Rhodospirillaceae bacterium]|nr:7-cyano-7-deazaguanine synthase QueC [Rhodospirillaceae bacterium]|tara:strand:- start:2932 stop:3651 length:720 start_codon:yes stop_codon:yes gene_type:complete
MRDQKALVLFSGGQDSTTCLAWALEQYIQVETIGFDYGQRHSVELECRPRILDRIKDDFPNWRDKLGQDQMIDISVLGEISETALTRDTAIQMEENGLPSTFVPGRNLIFLTMAGAVAYRRAAKHIVGGMCETDFSGYPDCRDDALKAMQLALNIGMDGRFVIDSPLMWINKSQTWQLAEQLGGSELVSLILEDTHSCYFGDRTNRHEWGYGCAACPACDLRKSGYQEYRNSSTSIAIN